MASSSSSGKLSKECQLLIACLAGNLQQVKDLVMEMENEKEIYKPFVKIRDGGGSGTGLLHAAASGGRTNVCKYLLEELNFDVNEEDDNGYTPLLYASVGLHSRTILYLIEKSADPAAARDYNATALHYVAAKGNADVIPVLVANGADVNGLSDFGTPLCLASQKNTRDTVKSLLDNGANPNLGDGMYGTPLGATLSRNSTEFTELMLKAGADPNAVSCTKSPLGFAAAQGKLGFIKLLLKYKADPNIADEIGLLPIEHAAIHSNRMEIRALLPVTRPIPACSDWSVKGIIKYVNSQEAIHKRSSMIKTKNSIARAKGDDAFEREDYHQANQHYTEAITYDPSDAIAHARKSFCLDCLGNINGCLESAKICMTLRPDWPEAYLRLGTAYHVLKEFGKAAEVFLLGLRLDQQHKELQASFTFLIVPY
ncbi:hypothetical protein ACHQM5_014774 [Ranunculus cassubicifolius]